MLETLLTPKTVAIIGASKTPGKVGHDLLANLMAGGFPGIIVPVNPTTDAILGLACFPSLAALASPLISASWPCPPAGPLRPSRAASSRGRAPWC